MLQSVLILHCTPGKIDDLVEEYRRTGVLEVAKPFGLIRGEAIAHHDDLVVTSLWLDVSAYDSWLDSAERVRVTERIPNYLDPEQEQEIRKIPRDVALNPQNELPLDGVLNGAHIPVIVVH